MKTLSTENEKKSITTKDGRYRYWTIVVYPDSVPENWRELLNGWQWIESPLHDKDINPDGSLKKPHWHIVIYRDGKISFAQAKSVSDSLNDTSPQYVQNITGMVRYLVHMDNPEKAQYKKSEIKGHGIDITKFLETPEEFDKLMMEIEIFCEENFIHEYADLIRRSREFDNWHRCISTHTIHFRAFLASLRHGVYEKHEVKDLVERITDEED